MQLAEAMKRLETVVATTGSPDADTTAIGRALSASSQLKSFLAAQDAELAKMLHAVPGSFPEATIADATRCSLNDAVRDTDRAATLGHADAMADALANGDITPGHVDALTRAGRQLDDEQRAELFDQHEELAADAASQTRNEFNQNLNKRIKDLQRESGEERLDRQRRNTRLSVWTDTATDMVHLKGTFDPATGSEIKARLQDVVASIRAAGIPDTAPSDSLEQTRHLDAIALTHLVLRDNTSECAESSSDGVAPITLPTTSQRDALVVVDATNATTGPVIDHGLPVEIPFAVLRDLFGVESPDTVIVANGIVLHAPGNLDLGRTTRLANRAQRRALRGLYNSCAIPGCNVHYDRCKLHHITWWRHGGRTDLYNLLPVCQRHHAQLHDDHWQIELGPNRELTITLPNGQILGSGPPKRSAA